MRLRRITWLLILLLLIGVCFLQRNPHLTRAQASAASAHSSLGPVAPVMADPMKAPQMLISGRGPGSAGVSPAFDPTKAPQTLFSGLWRVDGNFQSTIHIKNSLVVAPVQVSPVLYMADGTEYDLPPVVIPATGTSMLSVNQALDQAPPAVRAHLSSYGSAALRYQGIPMSVTAKIEMLDASRSLLFTASFVRSMLHQRMSKSATETLEGIWWRHDPGVGGFVSFANSTAQTISVNFQVIGSEGATLPAQSLSLPAYSTQLLDLDRLTQGLPGLENQAGGIRVQWQGSAGDLAVNGGLENTRKGFSSDMQFWSHDLVAAPAASTMAGVGMMTGEPDASLGYPAGKRFMPYAVLRNTTSHPLSVKLVVHEASGTDSYPPSLRVLKPLETIRIDVTPWLADTGRAYTSWALNLVLSYTGRKGDLVVDTGSLDQGGRYNMPALVQPLEESLSQESPFWTVADGWDTMYLLWNWTDKAEDVVVTFYYSDGSGHFKLPVHLEAWGSVTLDMAKLIAGGQTDAEGNAFPAGMKEGSAVFSSPKGVTTPISLAIWGAHFNARLGVAEACCLPCVGYYDLAISLSSSYSPISSFAVAAGQSIQLYALVFFGNGTLYDVTSGATWSSANTAVATVSGGLVTGVAGGSCQITASISLKPTGNKAFGCGGCPGPQNMQAGAAADVCDFVINGAPEPATCDGKTKNITIFQAQGIPDVCTEGGRDKSGFVLLGLILVAIL